MIHPLAILLAVMEAAPAFLLAAMPTDMAAPTMQRVEALASDPTPENMRHAYDGATAPYRPSYVHYALRAPAVAPATPLPTQLPGKPLKIREPAAPLVDAPTMAYAALGAVSGGIIGFALVAALGPFGPILGAILGAFLLAGLWRATAGYGAKKTPLEKVTS